MTKLEFLLGEVGDDVKTLLPSYIMKNAYAGLQDTKNINTLYKQILTYGVADKTNANSDKDSLTLERADKIAADVDMMLTIAKDELATK